MQLITPPTTEPISVDELAKNLRLLTGDTYTGTETTELQRLISAARADAEHYTGRFFAQQTWRQVFAAFANPLPLHPDCLSIDAVQYVDSTHQSQTLPADAYFCDTAGNCHFTTTLPAVYSRPDAVQITFTVGAAYVEPTVKQAILLIASHWYENREASSPLQVREVPFAYQWLLDSHSIIAKVA